MKLELDTWGFFDGPPGWTDSQHVAPKTLAEFFRWLCERVGWLRGSFPHYRPPEEHIRHCARLWGEPIPAPEDLHPKPIGESSEEVWRLWHNEADLALQQRLEDFAKDNRLRLARHVIDNAVVWLDANGHPGVLNGPVLEGPSGANRELSRLAGYVKAQLDADAGGAGRTGEKQAGGQAGGAGTAPGEPVVQERDSDGSKHGNGRRLWLNATAAARRVGVSAKTMRTWISDHKVEIHDADGQKYLFNLDELEEHQRTQQEKKDRKR